MNQAAQKLAELIVGDDKPNDGAYGILDVIVKDGANINDPVSFEGLCELQIEEDDEAMELWSDNETRSAAVALVHERARVALAEHAAKRAEMNAE